MIKNQSINQSDVSLHDKEPINQSIYRKNESPEYFFSENEMWNPPWELTWPFLGFPWSMLRKADFRGDLHWRRSRVGAEPFPLGSEKRLCEKDGRCTKTRQQYRDTGRKIFKFYSLQKDRHSVLMNGVDKGGGIEMNGCQNVLSAEDITARKCVNQVWKPDTNQSINQSINPSNQSINQSINPSKNQSINQSINRPINQSINQSINRPINRPIDQSINRSILWYNGQ